jgi:hypothetical protein
MPADQGRRLDDQEGGLPIKESTTRKPAKAEPRLSVSVAEAHAPDRTPIASEERDSRRSTPREGGEPCTRSSEYPSPSLEERRLPTGATSEISSIPLSLVALLRLTGPARFEWKASVFNAHAISAEHRSDSVSRPDPRLSFGE